MEIKKEYHSLIWLVVILTTLYVLFKIGFVTLFVLAIIYYGLWWLLNKKK